MCTVLTSSDSLHVSLSSVPASEISELSQSDSGSSSSGSSDPDSLDTSSNTDSGSIRTHGSALRERSAAGSTGPERLDCISKYSHYKSAVSGPLTTSFPTRMVAAACLLGRRNCLTRRCNCEGMDGASWERASACERQPELLACLVVWRNCDLAAA